MKLNKVRVRVPFKKILGREDWSRCEDKSLLSREEVWKHCMRRGNTKYVLRYPHPPSLFFLIPSPLTAGLRMNKSSSDQKKRSPTGFLARSFVQVILIKIIWGVLKHLAALILVDWRRYDRCVDMIITVAPVATSCPLPSSWPQTWPLPPQPDQHHTTPHHTTCSTVLTSP